MSSSFHTFLSLSPSLSLSRCFFQCAKEKSKGIFHLHFNSHSLQMSITLFSFALIIRTDNWASQNVWPAVVASDPWSAKKEKDSTKQKPQQKNYELSGVESDPCVLTHFDLHSILVECKLFSFLFAWLSSLLFLLWLQVVNDLQNLGHCKFKCFFLWTKPNERMCGCVDIVLWTAERCNDDLSTFDGICAFFNSFFFSSLS